MRPAKHLQRLRKLGPDAEILQTLQSSTGSIVGASFNDRIPQKPTKPNLRYVPSPDSCTAASSVHGLQMGQSAAREMRVS